MGLMLLQAQAIQQPRQLSTGDCDRPAFSVSWPPEAAPFKTPVVKPEAVVFPAQHFELIATAIAKHKPGISKRIKVERILHQGG